MKKLIENIKENCKITIKGKEYKVLSKAYYITDINNLTIYKTCIRRVYDTCNI